MWGGSDDSLLLLDYFGMQQEEKLPLKGIMADLHIDTILKNGDVNDGDAYFETEDSCEAHFDMAVDVVADLSAILLESLESGVVEMSALDDGGEYANTFSILADKEDVSLLLGGLDSFISAPQEYGLAEMMTEEDLQELVGDCIGIRDALRRAIDY